MRRAVERLVAGGDASPILAELQDALLSGGFSSVDYAVLADAESLQPIERRGDKPARLLVAARLGTTRLIDNMPVGEG
jgi:pantoate--beta-alanine ligase